MQVDQQMGTGIIPLVCELPGVNEVLEILLHKGRGRQVWNSDFNRIPPGAPKLGDNN